MIARLPKARIVYACFRPGLEGGHLFRLRLLRTTLPKAMRRGYSAENV